MSQTSEDAFVVRHVCAISARKMHLALHLCAARVTSNKLLDQYNWWVFPYGYNSVIYNTQLYSEVKLETKSLAVLCLH